MEKSVLIGMSGGIDSSVCALLLKQQGYTCYGATLMMRDDEGTKKDIIDAKHTCEKLGIEHIVIDCTKQFWKNVVIPFGKEYSIGNTPNPCVICNKTTKIPILLAEADKRGIDYIATGHYVNKEFDGKNYYLTLAKDIAKDQTYVLYTLNQETLKRTLFPMGKYSKEYTKSINKEQDLTSQDRPESQDICFISDDDYGKFLSEKLSINSKPGDFISTNGKILGKHNGITNYTIGQRRGLGVSADSRLFVLKKDTENNNIVLGKDEELYTDIIHVKDFCWQSIDIPTEPINAMVTIRYHRKASEATIYPNGLITFKEPQRAPTPGQSAVFYDGEKLLGGAIIC